MTHPDPQRLQIRRLEPHAPVPDGRSLTVLQRFDEDDPRRVITELVLGTAPGRADLSHPARPDGTPMKLPEAIAAARQIAATESLTTIYVIDRTAGPREKDVLAHDGDHSARGAPLDDTDMEDGERGADFRDARL